MGAAGETAAFASSQEAAEHKSVLLAKQQCKSHGSFLCCFGKIREKSAPPLAALFRAQQGDQNCLVGRRTLRRSETYKLWQVNLYVWHCCDREQRQKNHIAHVACATSCSLLVRAGTHMIKANRTLPGVSDLLAGVCHMSKTLVTTCNRLN